MTSYRIVDLCILRRARRIIGLTAAAFALSGGERGQKSDNRRPAARLPDARLSVARR